MQVVQWCKVFRATIDGHYAPNRHHVDCGREFRVAGMTPVQVDRIMFDRLMERAKECRKQVRSGSWDDVRGRAIHRGQRQEPSLETIPRWSDLTWISTIGGYLRCRWASIVMGIAVTCLRIMSRTDVAPISLTMERGSSNPAGSCCQCRSRAEEVCRQYQTKRMVQEKAATCTERILKRSICHRDACRVSASAR